MKLRWSTLPQLMLLIVSTLILMGQQSITPKPPTRADSPGFGVLGQAKQLRKEQKLKEGYIKVHEAIQIFKDREEWEFWGDCYEEAYQISRAFDSIALYRTLMAEFAAASQIVVQKKEMPVKTQAIIWGRLGRINHILGAYDLAVHFYEKALPFAEQTTDSFQLMQLYCNAATLIWAQGDDYRALNYQEKALSLATAQHDTAMMAVTTSSLGSVWRYLDPKKSVQIYLQALALKPNDSETLMLLSKAYLEGEKNHPKALESANESLQFAETQEEKADALHQLGRVFFERKNYNRALALYDEANSVALGSYGKSHPECAKIHMYRGKAFLEKKEYKQALLAFNKTLDDLLPLFSPQNEDQNPNLADLTTTSLWILESLLGKARVYERMFSQNHEPENLVRSLDCAELALFYQNKIKLRYGDDESKFLLSSYFNTSCEAALHSAFRLFKESGSPEYARRAFRLSEQTKAVVLAEALYKKEMKQVANVPAEQLENERKTQEHIAYFEKKLMDSDEPGQVTLLKDSLFMARRQLEIQDRQIVENYPAYGEALFSYRTDVPADSIRRHLPEDVALLEYFLGDSAVYSFLLTRDTFWVHEQALPENFDRTASVFLRTVNDWQFVTDSSTLAGRLFLENSRLLYQWLLEKPLAVTKAKRLFIVPDGKLSLLPFELFLTQPYAGQWIDRDVPFLMKERSVSYRFSSRNQTRSHGTRTDGWGGFGLEYDEHTLSAAEKQPGSRGLRDFGPLPFADDEIMAINGVLGGSFWLNGDATRDNFLKNAERYGILHLAMHGMVDERNPLRSRLLFSSSVADSDPFVYASDLYNLQLQAGLSVLSACQSGTGAWKKGEGVLSLARAFAFAGCPSMVMSLWNVSDQSTSELMVSFYKQLKAGATKDEALRSAKLDYLNTVSPEYAKPIYWAAFVPIGEMNNLPESYFSGGSGWASWLCWGAAFVVLIFMGFWLWRKRFKK